MFFSVFDEGSATLVGKYDGKVQSDADYQRCVDAIRTADECAVARNLPCICILIVPTGVERPPAVWRTRMAETNNANRATEHRLALVMSDTLMRGVLTAITWLTRPRAGHHMKPFETFTSAAEWIRTTTGLPYPDLERLNAAVEKEMAKRAASA